jgi:hypothetical protein
VDSEFLLFEESDTADELGRPFLRNKRKFGDEYGSPMTVVYPRGLVRIRKYDFVHGTHFASKVSDFQAIARCIEEMHKAGIIHGDVCGFSMLHPHPEPVAGEPTIEKSLLIDFDLSSMVGTTDATYPPGYASRVPDNQFPRCGVQKKRYVEGSRLARTCCGDV